MNRKYLDDIERNKHEHLYGTVEHSKENEKLMRLSDAINTLMSMTLYDKNGTEIDDADIKSDILQGWMGDIPAVDAVEVVRCRKCLYRGNRWTGCPKLHGLETPDDFFCKYGKQKEDT